MVTRKLWKVSDLIFLVPTLAIIATLFPFYRKFTTEKVKILADGNTFDYVPWPSYGIWLVIALMAFYGFFTYFRFWGSPKIGLRENHWLRWFIGSYFGFVAMFTAYIFLTWFGIMDPKYDYFVDIVIVFFIGMLSFFGFVQPEVFEGKSLKEVVPFIKYRKTGLSPALSLEMKGKLLDIMAREKPYLNNELRLDDLSRLMNLSRNHTSQIINEHFNLSFFDFVNRYRIREAKNTLIMLDKNELTVTQIAYDVGFNNRASFYKAFKKFTSENPSDYLKKIKAF